MIQSGTNPYPGYFPTKTLERLTKFVKMGLTSDAERMGLASKFELEALNEYLLTSWGMVMLQVPIFLFRTTPSKAPCNPVRVVRTSFRMAP